MVERAIAVCRAAAQRLPLADMSASARDTLIVLLVIGALLAATGALVWLRRRRREQRPRDVEAEWRARAVMGELCPHGWQAQITLYGWQGPVPADAPWARAPLVELEWRHYDDQGEVAGAGRCWAPSVAAGLQTMLDSRWQELASEAADRSAQD
jgi:LPXTG-motif cell wall-anchored protein